MPRGYRSIILAVLGCLSLANAAHHNHQHRDQRERATGNQQAQAAPPVVEPPVSPADPKPDHAQCIDEQYRNRDCASASAQATIDQASYAYWQVIAGALGVLIGLGTLAAAFLAAKWAKSAAKHTESGSRWAEQSAIAAKSALDASTKVSNAELRPWIKLDARLTAFEMTTDQVTISYQMEYRNIGSTVARNISTHVSVICADYGKITEKIARAFTQKQIIFSPKTALMPGDHGNYIGEAMNGVASIIKNSDSSFFCIIAASAVYYSDLDHCEHRSEQAFAVMPANGDPFDNFLDATAIGRKLDDVTISRFTTGQIT